MRVTPAWPLMALVALAWSLRPASYAAVLDGLSRDALWNFDRHGFGLMWDVIVHAAGLPFLLAAAWWAARHPGRAARPGWLSWPVLALLGTPSLAGALALRDLPFGRSWPVALSSVLWFAACLRLRAAWVGGGRGG